MGRMKPPAPSDVLPEGVLTGGVWEETLEMCHFDPETGGYRIVPVSTIAVPEQLARGDTLYIDCCVSTECSSTECLTATGCVSGACSFDVAVNASCTSRNRGSRDLPRRWRLRAAQLLIDRRLMTWGLPRQPPRLSHRVRSGDSTRAATASHPCQPEAGLRELSQHAQGVHLRPALDDLAAGEAIDIDAGELRGLAGGAMPEPWTVLVPVPDQRTTTRSPSAIVSSTVRMISGNELEHAGESPALMPPTPATSGNAASWWIAEGSRISSRTARSLPV